MAAALLNRQTAGDAKVDSAGVYEGGLDPFVEIVMQELGVSLVNHEPKTLSNVELENVDVIVALTPEAAVEARRFLPREKIEFWDIENPSQERGGREAILEAYRGVRDELQRRLQTRFAENH